MEQTNELISKFCEITGADENRATFYIDSSGGDLQLALSSFYESDLPENDDIEIINDAVPPLNQRSAVETDLFESEIEELPLGQRLQKENTMGDRDNKVATLFNTKKDEKVAGSGSSSDEDERRRGQEFYVGGSTHSGQQILGPPRRRNANEVIDEVFKKAQEHGAEVIDPSRKGVPDPSQGSSKSYGRGYRLGWSDNDHELVNDNAAKSESPRQTTVVLTMWKNGFSIDNGPLRLYSAPENKLYLQAIMKGEIPPELLKLHPGVRIDLHMENRQNEEYKPPPPSVKPFQGKGYTLGSVTTADQLMARSRSPSPGLMSSEDPNTSDAADGTTQNDVSTINNFNDQLPHTQVQIRLADGKKLTLKLNHSHTVGDIRMYILSLMPEMANRRFVLMTTFPNKELSDDGAAVSKANLLNSVLVQRFK